jgi:putative hemolysin
MSSETEYISIQKLIKESDSKLLKRMPLFIIWLIQNIIRQDEINRILNKFAAYEGIDFLPKIIEELNLKVIIEGKENLPENGRCFFVANHPFGIVDGLVLTNTVAGKYGSFKAIGNEVFALVPHLKPIIANVSVFGTNPRNYLLELEKVFASDLPITHFPAGLVSRLKSGKIEDSSWHKSFITKAVEHQRNIVPLYFYGRNSHLFYMIYVGRKALGIKTKLELVLLLREIFNKKNKTIKVKIGSPISYQTFNNTKTHAEWAQYVKVQVYNLLVR